MCPPDLKSVHSLRGIEIESPDSMVRKTWYVIPALLLGASIASGVLFCVGFDNFFYNDDFALLYASKHQSVLDILADRKTIDDSSLEISPYWRPGWRLLFKTVYAIQGLNPFAYLATSLTLHLAMLLLILIALFRIGIGLWPCLLATLFFISAPACSEAVWWIMNQVGKVDFPRGLQPVALLSDHLPALQAFRREQQVLRGWGRIESLQGLLTVQCS